MQKFVVFLLGFILFFLYLPEINLTNSDLGRHLKNGEIILENLSIPSVNFYSYTYPNFTFYNHHWLSGVIFYLIKVFCGFKGVSIFSAVITFLTFIFFIKSVEKEISSLFYAVLIFILSAPLICSRTEIRPELFSYFLSSVYFFILHNFLNNNLGKKYLLFLPLAQVLWINLHIYFFVGLVLILFSILAALISYLITKNNIWKNKMKNLLFIFITCMFVCIINPYGIKGLFIPATIFKNYGYKVFENQSVWFIDKVVKNYLPNLNYKLLLIILMFSWGIKIYFAVIKKTSIQIFVLCCFIFFSILSLLAIRNFAIFGYFSIPIFISNLNNVKIKKKNLLFICCLTMFILVYKINPYVWNFNIKKNIGLKQNNEYAAKFFIENNLSGPILNNYDIGSYLIYYLFPCEKVFVDNRPEAYPKEFFNSIYIPLMEDEKKWTEFDKIYNFNTIFFYHHDYTPWGQNFLINRVFDKEWAAVFVDHDCIILLKRNLQNKEIIEKYELPKEIFKVRKTT